MKKSLIATIVLVLVAATAACDRPVDESPLTTPGATTEAAPPSRRPPPATSGIGSDPDNPNGAPGTNFGINQRR
jgi:hypothetical protein